MAILHEYIRPSNFETQNDLTIQTVALYMPLFGLCDILSCIFGIRFHQEDQYSQYEKIIGRR